ncbi:TPA: helix-turn-helix transcriptional regulator, partial [Staphylococcus aureus]|nr:helix-turn-helix transcriptional regulator [Staphylococcus aureus]
MEIGKELKKLRKENNITQEYLAEKLYVSIQTVNKWENGKCLPDAINLLHIAQFYGVSLDVLMKNEMRKNKKVKHV